MPILLANPPHTDTFGYSMPPPGLMRLGGWLRDAGIAVELEDLAFRLAHGEVPAGDELGLACAEFLLERMDRDRGPWVLGLSTMGATLPVSLVIARIVREHCPGVPILFGGPGTTGCDELILRGFPAVDAVVRGEGEVTLAQLMANWERQTTQGDPPSPAAFFQQLCAETSDEAPLLGVTWRSPDGQIRVSGNRPVIEDLEQLSAPAWDLLPPISAYKRITGAADGLVPIDSGRGCAFDCSFCTIGRFWSRRSRPLPPARLAAEIEAALAMPGAKSAYLCHDIFGADRKSAMAFCREMEGRGHTWEVRARIDHLDDELIGAMASAGCYRVLLGIESAAESVRLEAGKPLRGAPSRAQILHSIQALSSAGVTPILSIILGLPGESDSDLRDTLDFAAEASLAGAAQLSFHLVNPQPGCELGELYSANSRPVEGIAPDMALGAGLTQPERDLIEARPDLFSSWSLLTGLEGGVEKLKHLHQLAKFLPAVLMRYPRTFAGLKGLLDLDTHDLALLALEATCSFEGMARRLNNPLVDDLLLWEMTRLRVGARGRVTAGVELPNGAPLRVLVDTIKVRHDLGAIDALLAAGEEFPEPSNSPIYFAVGSEETSGDGGSSLRTHRITADLAELLQILRDGHIEPGGPLGENPSATIEHLATLAEGSLLSIFPAPHQPSR
ncbi:MAG: radical SAM protein [Planctomycetota bacterium]|nr:radical SAM protein [Planctomycetota bacterium]